MYFKLIIIFILLLSCEKNESSNSNIIELANLMIGSYSNKTQIADKYSYTLQNLSELWKSESDIKWILERQTLSISPDDIFRQRIYRISISDEQILRADVFFLPQLKQKAGVEEIQSLTPDSLILREGCSIYFRKENNKYIGATYGDQCENSYQNASHMIEEFEISKKEFKTWILGYSADGNKVWGSKETALVYNRISN